MLFRFELPTLTVAFMARMIRKAGPIFDRILDVFSVIACVVILSIMVAVSVKVVFRYFLLARLIGVDELAESALLYITFLGGAWLLRREGHVSIDILFIRLRKGARTLLTVITSLLGAAVSTILVYSGTIATIDVWRRGVFTPTILEVPKVAILCIIPLGSTLLAIQFLRRAWSGLRTKRDG